jgi:hypothetical protein
VLPDGSQDVVSGNSVGRPIDISADGRWVLMASGVNLTGDGAPLPSGPRLFLRDTQAGVTRTLAGLNAYGGAALSASGRFVAIVVASGAGASFATDLLVYDGGTDTITTALSVSAATFPDGIGGVPSLTDDGRYVAFTIRSSTLLNGEASVTNQVAVLDRAEPDPARALSLESVSSTGVTGDGPSDDPRLSGDGRYLLFHTKAPNLAGDPAATIRNYLMVRDRQLHTTRVASRRVDGSNVWVGLFGHALSGDGSVLAFVADMADMVSPTTLGEYQVFAAPRP